MAPPSDPVADVWRSPELLGCVAPFLDPSHAAWSFIRVNKAAAAAAYGDSGQLVPRTPGEPGGAVVAAGLSPPQVDVLIAAASAGRLGACRWLAEGLGCPGLHRLACLSLISAAGPGPGVVEEARAWLAPAARERWSAEQEAQAARGDVEAVVGLLRDWQPGGVPAERNPSWGEALNSVRARRDLQQPSGDVPTLARLACLCPEFYSGPHAALAVARLTQLEPAPDAFAFIFPYILFGAAKAGHAEAVRYLLSRGVRPDTTSPDAPALAAACNGHVGVLQALHEAGCMGDPARCFAVAALAEAPNAGTLPVVEWLVGTFGAPAFGAGGINHHLTTAARSGSVQLLKALPGLLGSAAPAWDRCRGACWANAAASGCEEAVEWLAKEAGVPDESRQDTYLTAASQGDLRMVQRLRRLGCPYSARDAEALAEAARRVPASAAALPWLEEPSCPVGWGPAAAEADARPNAEAKAVTFLHGVVTIAHAMGETLSIWTDPPTWGCVRFRLLVVVLPLAVTVAWLYVEGLSLRKPLVCLSIALFLAQQAVSSLGVPISMRLAIVFFFRLVGAVIQHIWRA
ncbi:hypothetical protein HYH03_017963 [Edaphochlamys debaryana]|uniref:Uncharacterized protein n=1 Tax=Edaphochlamys debaryana TaxID=47281 RepID=A0A835XJ00_9CHLO|nr:hypothetical protein HYH03_017963 [Edaphochlamys debaryana]|eukprot:KAG2483171.1 hypothetical protein HYH03_017963 [Edaphochlamys debaryana]